MVRNRKRLTERGADISALEAAYDAVKKNEMKTSTAAKHYGVDRMTLTRLVMFMIVIIDFIVD